MKKQITAALLITLICSVLLCSFCGCEQKPKYTQEQLALSTTEYSDYQTFITDLKAALDSTGETLGNDNTCDCIAKNITIKDLIDLQLLQLMYEDDATSDRKRYGNACNIYKMISCFDVSWAEIDYWTYDYCPMFVARWCESDKITNRRTSLKTELDYYLEAEHSRKMSSVPDYLRSSLAYDIPYCALYSSFNINFYVYKNEQVACGYYPGEYVYCCFKYCRRSTYNSRGTDRTTTCQFRPNNTFNILDAYYDALYGEKLLVMSKEL